MNDFFIQIQMNIDPSKLKHRTKDTYRDDSV